MSRIATIVLTMALVTSGQSPSLETVKTERNLEKRSEKALQYADAVVDKLRQLYKQGDWKGVESALQEIHAAVDLARASLNQSGKNPRKNPKYFKQAELKTRQLARRLESFAQGINFDERPLVESVREHVMKIHDRFLEDVMSSRK